MDKRTERASRPDGPKSFSEALAAPILSLARTPRQRFVLASASLAALFLLRTVIDKVLVSRWMTHADEHADTGTSGPSVSPAAPTRADNDPTVIEPPTEAPPSRFSVLFASRIDRQQAATDVAVLQERGFPARMEHMSAPDAGRWRVFVDGSETLEAAKVTAQRLQKQFGVWTQVVPSDETPDVR